MDRGVGSAGDVIDAPVKAKLRSIAVDPGNVVGVSARSAVAARRWRRHSARRRRPGGHDPQHDNNESDGLHAEINTRTWKRGGPGGPPRIRVVMQLRQAASAVAADEVDVRSTGRDAAEPVEVRPGPLDARTVDVVGEEDGRRANRWSRPWSSAAAPWTDDRHRSGSAAWLTVVPLTPTENPRPGDVAVLAHSASAVGTFGNTML